jgi:hypothetical protein
VTERPEGRSASSRPGYSAEETTARILPSTSPQVLRELAALIEEREPSRRARQSLSPDKLDELADMLLRGKRPTIGWWQRALAASRQQP